MDMQSQDIDKLAGALAKAQGAMKAAAFDRTMTGEKYSFRYATLASVHDAARKPLADNGLAVVQTTIVDDGKLWLYTTLMHESGQFMRTVYPVINLGNVTPQAIGSALTYARRYSFSAIVNVAGDEDDDGNGGGGQNNNQRNQRQQYTNSPRQPAPPPPAANGNGQSKPAVSISADRINEIDRLGAAHYGAEGWPAKRTELVSAVSAGRVKELDKLTAAEGEKMSGGIAAKIEAAIAAGAGSK